LITLPTLLPATDRAHHVAFESYLDCNALPYGGQTNAKITGGVFPNSLATFMHQLG
jgi:hypothetical protein